MISYNKVHNRFKLNGIHYDNEDLKSLAYNLVKEGEAYEKTTGNFLIDWLDDKDYVLVKTSGSTGKPKSIKVKKQAMLNSAIATGRFFRLKPGNTALHCLPNHYIAGKMMLVRAIILGLEIDCIEPSAQPKFDSKKAYDFCAMIPLQLKNVLERTNNINTIIIGGSKTPKPLLNAIRPYSSRFYETYGMTETVTHVAIRQLQSKVIEEDKYFKALPSVTFSVDESQCLIINAPDIVDTPLVTNDIVDLKSETSFKLLGRKDNVINSGGVKLFPEQIEDKLHPIINERFFVAGINDDDLGEKLVLIIENPTNRVEDIINDVKALKTLDKFEIPKNIYAIKKFSETNSGKIQRKKTLKNALGN